MGIPLLLVPIGGHRSRAELISRYFKDLLQEALDCMFAGWALSMKFSRIIYPKVLSSIRNPLVRKVVNSVAEKALETMENWISMVREDPEVVEREFSKVNLRHLPSLVAVVIRSRTL